MDGVFVASQGPREGLPLRGGLTAAPERKARRLRTFSTGLLSVFPGSGLETWEVPGNCSNELANTV